MMKVAKVAIITGTKRKMVLEAARELAGWLKSNLVESSAHCGKSTDLAVFLGGDGLIMHRSLELAKLDIPFLGINFGTVGFLAVAEKDNWKEVMGKVLDGRYTVEKRPILAATHFQGGKVKRHLEAVGNIYIRHRADMILLNVSVDGEPVYKEIRADGVIVATPTGATAYNLSARGKIISTGFVVTPLWAHALDVESLPVPDSKRIEIVYLGRKSRQGKDEGCILFDDGGRYPIEPGDRVEIKKHDKEASFIIPEGFSFFESLRKKLSFSK